ncbi:peptide chain release factor N(5)-glutamine methyltransferase [Oecophyllibacter saccharovorans]|uniref:peptide chain release factor N(5)-glutamine methyltransferase n=1 Tax=Oecophyllibacter saccharovorans TaxID=2558360 RepID=UPI0011423141|nr:peptide chain release factor N(5)-glutamine methyltransferase [Oecophyllibacter saccharovorans]QDH15893.1 peptide chain release factor N(5)-glutamine methyltransferase [Oecophyllibacter saccharovorans]
MSCQTVAEWLQAGTQQLSGAGVEEPRAEARYLLQWATGLDRLALLQRNGLSHDERQRYWAGMRRRVLREPMAYITGRQGFWTLDLEVSPATLIPRPDSECLIETLLSVRPEPSAVRSILDLGTGTGCLLLAALTAYRDAWGIGVDLAPEAALLAQRNAHCNTGGGKQGEGERSRLSERAFFMAGNWGDALQGRFDVVLSNPPYIESATVPQLMPEVATFEPGRALDGGPDGLDAYRLICERLPDLLAPGGCAILELGQGQEAAVTALASQAGLRPAGCGRDLGGIARALVLENPDSAI